MKKVVDLTGQKFERLTVIARSEDRIQPNNAKIIMWKCLCDCQTNKELPEYKYVRGADLKNGKVKSCGCLQKEIASSVNKINLVGKKFGRLTVIKQEENHINSQEIKWWCICDCQMNLEKPEMILVSGNSLRSGNTKSCGCLNRDSVSKRMKEMHTKFNVYDLSGEYGIGYTLKGEEFYFDLEDYNKIKDYCWNIDANGYVVTHNRNNHKVIKLHRLLLDITDKHIQVDHIKHKLYDNRKIYLRIANNSLNMENRTIGKNNSSGTVGVSWHKRDSEWVAYIDVDNERINLGTFNDKENAIRARKEAEEKHFGKWSYDNSMKRI